MSDVSAPLRLSLDKTTEWHRETRQNDSFNQLKKMASESPALAFYDKNEELILNVDASTCGLGAVLIQKARTVAYVSRALNTTQRKYAQIERETLTIVYVD